MAHERPSTIGLERRLGLKDLTLLIIGTVIGSGIFIVPGAVLRQIWPRAQLRQSVGIQCSVLIYRIQPLSNELILRIRSISNFSFRKTDARNERT